MKIDINQNFEHVLREVYNTIHLISDDGEVLSICMRDSGFEIHYGDKFFELKEEKVIFDDRCPKCSWRFDIKEKMCKDCYMEYLKSRNYD